MIEEYCSIPGFHDSCILSHTSLKNFVIYCSQRGFLLTRPNDILATILKALHIQSNITVMIVMILLSFHLVCHPFGLLLTSHNILLFFS